MKKLSLSIALMFVVCGVCLANITGVNFYVTNNLGSSIQGNYPGMSKPLVIASGVKSELLPGYTMQSLTTFGPSNFQMTTGSFPITFSTMPIPTRPILGMPMYVVSVCPYIASIRGTSMVGACPVAYNSVSAPDIQVSVDHKTTKISNKILMIYLKVAPGSNHPL